MDTDLAGRRGRPVIAFATYDRAPEGTADDMLAGARLAASCGASIEPVVWNSPSVDWGAYSAVLVRSTWDYHRCADAFVAWAVAVEAAGTSLWNPAPVIRWNADKRYLAELESAGVPIVPTEWVARGGEAELGPLLERRGWREAVVKPAVGATSYRTHRVRAADIADHVDLLSATAADSDALVQPFMPEVGRDGEWSFVFFDDGAGALAYSHAVLKRPGHGEFRVSPNSVALSLWRSRRPVSCRQLASRLRSLRAWRRVRFCMRDWTASRAMARTRRPGSSS